ncbi:MAG TPA: hypothetical protein VES95_08500 [Dermatophilaceae bacterium]|nr:hypothetical protein [Dermatophilaceae bacterium]
MTSSTELPLWAVLLVGLGTALLAFLGSVIGQRVARRGDEELERRSRREEVMRNLRWAAELAVRDDPRVADLGVSELRALARTDLLGPCEKVFVQAALDTVVEAPQEAVEERGGPVLQTVETVQSVETVETVEARAGPPAAADSAPPAAADSAPPGDVPLREQEEDRHG